MSLSRKALTDLKLGIWYSWAPNARQYCHSSVSPCTAHMWDVWIWGLYKPRAVHRDKRPSQVYNTAANLSDFFQGFPVSLKKPSRQPDKAALWEIQLPLSAYTLLSVCFSSKPLSHFESFPMWKIWYEVANRVLLQIFLDVSGRGSGNFRNNLLFFPFEKTLP